MTDRQVLALLDMLKVEIYGSSQSKEHNVKSFQLLHVLINRKVMLPQIYDLMERVKTIMISTNNQQVQDECTSVSITYIQYQNVNHNRC